MTGKTFGLMAARIDLRAVAGGLLATALGAFVLWEGTGYVIGTARRMGPGWFPVALGTLLVILGLALSAWGMIRRADSAGAEETPGTVRPDTASIDTENPDWRALAAIVAGLAGFALLVERAGLVPAVFALVAISSLAAGPPRPLRVAALAGVVSLLSYLVFRLGLGLPLPAFAGWR